MAESEIVRDEAREEIMPLHSSPSQRQHPSIEVTSGEKEHQPSSRKTSPTKAPGRATRFLSIVDQSAQLPSAALLKLRKWRDRSIRGDESFLNEEISDELLDKIPFRIEIIPDRRDDLDFDPAASKKSRPKDQMISDSNATIPSALTDERRMQIIQEVLDDLRQRNVLDEVRRANAVPYRLPQTNQTQKNIAERIRELTGSDTIMLNDYIYMKNVCQRLEEKHQRELEAHFQQLASPEHR